MTPSKSDDANPMLHAIAINTQRREVRAKTLRDSGSAWMLECRDLWDSEDEDAGVYFAGCATRAEVDRFLKGLDPASDRVLGIYDLARPIRPQGPGLTLEQWMTDVDPAEPPC